MILPGFGADAQRKLAEAKVLIVGMGGLGCPALQYLARAGIGSIGIMDADQVSLSNLHRQVLFDEFDIGQLKVSVAARKITKLNSGIQLIEFPFQLNKENAFAIIEQFDCVVDATDNFSAKYLINDTCVLLKKAWVYGAVSGYEGQVAVMNNIHIPDPVHYRHLFPQQPLRNEFASCEETGVIGVLPGIIGTMQAAEVIKWITGLGKLQNGLLLNYHFLSGSWYEIALTPNPETPVIDESFFNKMNYNMECANEEEELEDIDITEIDVRQLLKIQEEPGHFILDVRELHEYPSLDFVHARIPMSVLKESLDQLPQQPVYIICHQGIRSVYAAQYIKLHKGVETFSVKGGLTAYFNAVDHE